MRNQMLYHFSIAFYSRYTNSAQTIFSPFSKSISGNSLSNSLTKFKSLFLQALAIAASPSNL